MSLIQDFSKALANAGIPCSEPIIAAGKIVRYRAGEDRDPNCWYILFDHGPMLAGAFGCWKRGLNEKWVSTVPTTATIAERRKLTAGLAAAQAARDDALQLAQEEAAVAAQVEWDGAKPVGAGHPYLIAKEVGAYGVRVVGSSLVVPISDGTELTSLQTISATGEKRFNPSGRIKGCHFLFGEAQERLFLCEGYATGASIHEATGLPFALAFTCGNIEEAARTLKKQYPETEIVICADDDWKTDGNPGLTKARQAARSTRSLLAVPTFGEDRRASDTDFNDLLKLRGSAVLCECLAAAAIPGLRPVGEILAKVEQFLRKYIAFQSDAECYAVTLWIAHTWVIELADTSPILAVTSAERECGKTRLFEVLELLCRNSWRVVSPTEAVLFRKIERDCPTLLLDETDTIFGAKAAPNAESVRAILNAGNRKGTTIPRTESNGKKFELKDFSVFCPKAVAGIGRLPDTVTSRSIPICMKRRCSSEPVDRFRFPHAKVVASSITEMLEVWSENFAPIDSFNMEAPDELSDRAQEGWILPLQIASAAGGDWPERARLSAIALHESNDNDMPVGTRMLIDMRTMFDHFDLDKVSTDQVIDFLLAIEESGWGNYGRHGLTRHSLAHLLRQYEIRPFQSREGGEPSRGYARSGFEDAWKRFCPTVLENSVTNVTPLPSGGSEYGANGNSVTDVTDVTVAIGSQACLSLEDDTVSVERF
ncbi:MAG: DUF3631 domain-containing protein [Armatimonadota bacterium]|nr:DUF3631 domain-containing protein [Armatimonadota bacterium]